jgi:hypothetical protein
VAGGLILGAFTLQGYFDPQWEAKQSRTADARAGAATEVAPVLRGRNRFVAREERSPASPVRITTATPAASAAPTKVAAPPPAKSVAPRKKVADKAKPAPSQQASFLWPWNPFSN